MSNSYFDDQARSIFDRLGMRGGTSSSQKSTTNTGRAGNSMYSDLSEIFEHPQHGGKIYVGNQTAAQSIDMLRSHKITHVVNCTAGGGALPCYHQDKLQYKIFDVSSFSFTHMRESDDAVRNTVDPVFTFIDSAITRGDSVLVHCLAGAHRAGTTGVMCLIHYEQLDVPQAIAKAKSLRPIIDPISNFPQLLHRIAHVKKSQLARQ